MYKYLTKGVCSNEISFDIVDNRVSNVSFVGGCNGNLKGLSILIEGMNVKDAIKKLKGITCDGKDTSCPDQLATALQKAISQT